MKEKRESHEIIFKEGRPARVILEIDEYQALLERLEDTEDLQALQKMRKKPLKFRKLEDFLKGYKPSV